MVIGSGSNSLSVFKRSVAGSPMVVCATTTAPQAVVSPLVWDTYLSDVFLLFIFTTIKVNATKKMWLTEQRYWLSVDGSTGWIVYGKGEVAQENILLKYKDAQPLVHVNYIGLSCWENPVDFAQIRIGSPVPRGI